MAKRTFTIKVTVDWEDYDDVDSELVLEDSGIYDSLKDGVKVELVKEEKNVRPKRRNKK